MNERKQIKRLANELTTLSIYHAQRIINKELKLEPMLYRAKRTTEQPKLYDDLIAVAKEINTIATSAIHQDLHAKVAASIRIEDAQRRLKKLIAKL